ncbi:MAG TPA: hypothetical protein VE569_06435 [Acidimicrobiia bacterium]|nr:hypothetical protein [Acidimicrobiia bacterium]
MSRDLTQARNLGLASAVLGGAAGTAQLLAGNTVWTGNKNDPTTLGVVTVLLALIIASPSLTAPGAATTGRRLTVSVGQGIPALIGLTTAGAAWLPAAVAGVVATRFALRTARQQGDIREAVGRNWSRILLTIFAIIYLFLGVTALGVAGTLGIIGGLAVFAVLPLRRRSRWGAHKSARRRSAPLRHCHLVDRHDTAHRRPHAPDRNPLDRCDAPTSRGGDRIRGPRTQASTTRSAAHTGSRSTTFFRNGAAV